jgi:hypothetical protein
MCFNKDVSLATFFIGLLFIILLINYGNKKYYLENNIFGYFLIFIIFIQFMEFIFWIDLDNNLGLNKIMTIFGSFINMCQPIFLFIIKLIFINPDLFSFTNYNLIVFLINIVYAIYILFSYSNFINNGNLITHQDKNCYLDWNWKKFYNRIFYLILLSINIIWQTDFNYSLFLLIVVLLSLFLSYKYFSYNIGEMWCFLSVPIPLLLYFY